MHILWGARAHPAFRSGGVQSSGLENPQGRRLFPAVGGRWAVPAGSHHSGVSSGQQHPPRPGQKLAIPVCGKGVLCPS